MPYVGEVSYTGHRRDGMDQSHIHPSCISYRRWLTYHAVEKLVVVGCRLHGRRNKGEEEITYDNGDVDKMRWDEMMSNKAPVSPSFHIYIPWAWRLNQRLFLSKRDLIDWYAWKEEEEVPVQNANFHFVVYQRHLACHLLRLLLTLLWWMAIFLLMMMIRRRRSEVNDADCLF